MASDEVPASAMALRVDSTSLQLRAPNTHMPLKEAVSFCRGAEVRKVLPYTDPDSMPWFWFLEYVSVLRLPEQSTTD